MKKYIFLLLAYFVPPCQSMESDTIDEIKEISHLYIIDPKERAIALIKDPGQTLPQLPSCDVFNGFCDMAMVDWMKQKAHQDVPLDQLMLVGRIECTAWPNTFFSLNTMKKFPSILELKVSEEIESEFDLPIKKVFHYYYLWLTPIEKTSDSTLKWISIPALHEWETLNDSPSIYPLESLEMLKLFVTYPREKKVSKKNALLTKWKLEKICINVERYMPTSLFNHYYGLRIELQELTTKIEDEDTFFLDALYLLPKDQDLGAKESIKKCIVM